MRYMSLRMHAIAVRLSGASIHGCIILRIPAFVNRITVDCKNISSENQLIVADSRYDQVENSNNVMSVRKKRNKKSQKPMDGYADGVTNETYGVTIDRYEVTNDRHGATNDRYEVTNDRYGVTNDHDGATNGRYGAANDHDEVTNDHDGATNGRYGVTNGHDGATNDRYEVTNGHDGMTVDRYEVTNDRYGVTNGRYGVTNGRYRVSNECEESFGISLSIKELKFK